jgi:hypothetical protein
LRLEPDDLGDTGANAARQGQGGVVAGNLLNRKDIATILERSLYVL